MKRLLLRARKDPFELVSTEASLDRNTIADNSGNLIFSGASYGILATRDTEVTADRFVIDPGAADQINERYDAYVIPLANAFRVSYEANLIRLTKLISKLRIPVVVLGVGAQSNVDYETDRLRRIEPAAKAFVGAVLDRGPSIGVRGAFTASWLQRLGFHDIEVIGCPSLFLPGPQLRIEKRLAALDRGARLTLTVSPYVKAMWPIVARHVARYPNLEYIAQDIDALERLLWGGSTPNLAMPTRMYVDPWPWIGDLQDRDFVFGTRIHGTIAALLAGTPAYVFAHDSRTLELAEYFALPHRRMTDVPADVDAAELHAEADFGAFNDGHAARFATFTAYLERHGLEHVFQPGEDPLAFGRRLVITPFPPAVTARRPDEMPRIGRESRRLRRALRRLRKTRRIRDWRARLARR